MTPIQCVIIGGVSLLGKIGSSVIMYQYWKKYKQFSAAKKGYQVICVAENTEDYKNPKKSRLFVQQKTFSSHL